MTKAGWQHFDHDADIGVVGTGGSLAEAFEQVALGMTAVITDEAVSRTVRVSLTCEAPDVELLLVDWLNALIFEMATRRLLFGAYSVTIDGDGRLHGEAWGEPVDRQRHRPAVEVKGATLTALEVRRTDGGWRAQCVLDV